MPFLIKMGSSRFCHTVFARLIDKHLDLHIFDIIAAAVSYTHLAPGGENMFFNDKNQERVVKGPLFESIFGEGAEYHFYGGHRMWLAPQLMLHTCVPDNIPVPYELTEHGVVLTPAAQKVPGMQPVMSVTMLSLIHI